ncbi:F-box domain-containing protein [Favolaschia claudopus]|uniref:F-box domain-containing protein n=1 Tax=Favolaschia claudopus TaxID=2862362 RepID=A0AAW0EF12_9AGAR
MQSDHSLPDELIFEILTPALKVSEETFSTPLLYNVVVVRSKAQAKALSIALSGNKQLGLFIKKLRVEGGFGTPMHAVLKCSPNISDLFLSFDIFSSDNTSGLCKGLPLINPTRLIIWTSSHKTLENKMLLQLLQSLSDAIAKWIIWCEPTSLLRIFDCPFASNGRLAQKLVPPIVKAKRLDTLTIQSAHCISWAYSQFKDCPLKAIHIRRPVSMFLTHRCMPVLIQSLAHRDFWDVPAEPPELPLITPSLDLSFVPLDTAPSAVKNHIWTRVIEFAMLLAADHSRTPYGDKVAPRLGLLLVSKLFYDDLSFIKHIAFRVPAQINKFAHILSQSPVIAQYVRSINLGTAIYFYGSDIVQDDSSSLTSILSQVSALVWFGDVASGYTPSIFWDAFAAMAKCSGRTLRECSVSIRTAEGIHSATIFDDMTALRVLHWYSRLIYTDIGSADVEGLTSIRRVKFSDDHSSTKDFLVMHGSKLTELELPIPHLDRLRPTKIFDLCSNLNSITFFADDSADNPPSVQDLYSAQIAHPLVKITFNMFWYKEKKQVISAGTLSFRNLNPNVPQPARPTCSWPTNEREIAKSLLVRWSEFLRPRGIALTNKTGLKWRPRLKVK